MKKPETKLTNARELPAAPAPLIATAALIPLLLLGYAGCAHRGAKRLPANEGGQTGQLSMNFTLVRDPEVERVVRVHHATPLSIVTQVIVSNPTGKVACLPGLSVNPELDAPQTGAYRFDARAVRDISCYAAPGSAGFTQIDVDYIYERRALPSDGPSDPGAVAAADSALQNALKDLVEGHYSPETRQAIQAVNLVKKESIEIPAPGAKPSPAFGGYEITPDDWLQIDPLSAPVAEGSGKAAAYRCILRKASGEGPNVVVFESGDAPQPYNATRGQLTCEFTAKRGARDLPVTVQASLLKRDEAVEQLRKIVASGHAAREARDKALHEESLDSIRNAIAPLVAIDASIVQRYNHLYALRQNSSVRQAREGELDYAKRFFAPLIFPNFAPGPHSFRIVPEKQSIGTSQGKVDHVDYVVRDGKTTYYPEEKADAPFTVVENAFAPFARVISNERWESVSHAPWPMLVCPWKTDDFAEVLGEFKEKSRDLENLPTRQTLWAKLSRFGAGNASECEGNDFEKVFLGHQGEFRPIGFVRQERYHFCYKKSSQEVRDGRELAQQAVYDASHITATYTSPMGGTIYRSISREQNEERKLKHPFFGGHLITGTRFAKSAAMPETVCVPSSTVGVRLRPDGMIEGFSAH